MRLTDAEKRELYTHIEDRLREAYREGARWARSEARDEVAGKRPHLSDQEIWDHAVTYTRKD